MEKEKVLFVCVNNTARSQMALEKVRNIRDDIRSAVEGWCERMRAVRNRVS
ncbi:MAG: hypothetical protein ACUVWO_01115 [Thermodesulfobacteriota bacterium]